MSTMQHAKPVRAEEMGGTVHVAYFRREDAKMAKNWLETKDLLHRDFRMQSSHFEGKECVAVPLKSQEIDADIQYLGIGKEFCRYSSKIMGNRLNRNTSSNNNDMSSIQRVILRVCQSFGAGSSAITQKEVEKQIKALPSCICPKSLELLGDERVIILSPEAFRVTNCQWRELVLSISNGNEKQFYDLLWSGLAEQMDSKMIARKGVIDPESKIRRSGHSLVWPIQGTSDESGKFYKKSHRRS